MATKPEFLVAKEKLLVALATITVTFLSPVSVILWETIGGVTKCHLFSQTSCPQVKSFVIDIKCIRFLRQY